MRPQANGRQARKMLTLAQTGDAQVFGFDMGIDLRYV
jgi:hypothetical protein